MNKTILEILEKNGKMWGAISFLEKELREMYPGIYSIRYAPIRSMTVGEYISVDVCAHDVEKTVIEKMPFIVYINP